MAKLNHLINSISKVLIVVLLWFVCVHINVYAQDMQGYKLVASSSKLELYFNDVDSNFYVKNKVTGGIWSSIVRPEQYDMSKLNKKLKGDLNSLFLLNYTNVEYANGSVQTLNIQNGKPVIVSDKIDNGIKVHYDFSITEPLPINAAANAQPNVTSHIKFDVDITLDEDSFCVNIPFDSIVEEGIQGIVDIQMLPQLGAATDGQEGYIFYPEGSGALLDFKDMSHYKENKKTWSVYGSDIATYMASLNTNRNVDYEKVMLPVYGVKLKDDAFLAIIEDGKETTDIALSPSGSIVRLNTINADFVYRRFFDDPRIKTKQIKKFDKDIIQQDHSIRFVVLEKENANYSAMANTYRNYLLDHQLIRKVIEPQEEMPIAIDLFMGIKEKGLLFDKYIPMTTYKQAEEILQQFQSNGINNIQTQLIGWTKDGYGAQPDRFPANSKLGGKSKLKDLIQFAKESSVELYLQANAIGADESSGGFSKRKDVVYLGNDTIVSGRLNKTFILSPSYVLNYVKKSFLKKASSYNVAGISYDVIGELAYYDYNKNRFSTKQDTVKSWSEILDTTNQTLGKTATVGGNQYVFNYVDRLVDIPADSKGYFFATESIPFYQMVVHGLIPYSGDKGNLSHDLNQQKLKWIEYGYMPSFELTYESSEKLNYTDYNNLFTSQYSDWMDTAVGVYNEFNKNIKHVWSEYMVSHQKIKQDVYKVTYSDGTVIYINYTNNDQKVDGLNIKALDYLVIKR